MRPIEFADQTLVLHANPNQKEIDGQEVGKLPIFTDGNQVISCWQLTFIERLKALWYGNIWLGIYSGRTQPPVWMSADKTVFSARAIEMTDTENKDLQAQFRILIECLDKDDVESVRAWLAAAARNLEKQDDREKKGRAVYMPPDTFWKERRQL